MPMETPEERLAYLRPDGVLATFDLAGGGQLVDVLGILDDAYSEVQLELAAVGARAPAFTCREEDVPGVDDGDAVTIAGRDPFWVKGEPKRDGTGMIVLMLRRG